ncbi:PREDICTED: uncharacterized protein LOC109125292 [Camelina sativa]|uniref:Uncharacterized protein LOC109125292 n=1 Tax=Camelina sativa TaxID=90675 RepID=A0ABM1Q6U3_CAMSA|nr:PREDICTED: uncharacterized protein LOC109125292 [Camelina sativa]
MQTVSSHNQISEATPLAPVKKAKNVIDSPVRRSPRKKKESVSKENQKCKLLDIIGENRVVAEGRWSSNNPDQVVHCAPLGPNAVRVWVDVVKVNDAAVWRRTSAIECMEDAIGTTLAWPEDKVVMV